MDSENHLRPLGARVLLRLAPPPGRRGLLHVPEAHRGRPQRGTVVAVGPGREDPRTGQRRPPGVSPGEHVIFTSYADVPAEDSREGRRADLVAVSQEEILCVLDGACCPYPGECGGHP